MRGASTRSLASRKARAGKPGVGGGNWGVDIEVDRRTTVVAGDSDFDRDDEKAAGAIVAASSALGSARQSPIRANQQNGGLSGCSRRFSTVPYGTPGATPLPSGETRG
jgi:hypothetical protein